MNSCDSSKKAIENSNKMQEKLSGTYYITELKDTDASSYKLTINFDENSNKVTGFSGCNNFFGNYTLLNNTLKFSDIATSKKMCQKDIVDVEYKLLKSLNSVNSFSTNANEISFSKDDTILIKGSTTMVTSGRSSIVNYESNTTVKYQALSRGSFDFIMISKSNISISTDKGLQKIDKYTIDAKDWEILNELIEAIDAETMNTLKPPSTKHQYDGAPHATLAIILGDVEYKTPAFDHGNPPKTIEALVNKVLSIKEKTIKQ